jgi:hypothetical protein
MPTDDVAADDDDDDDDDDNDGGGADAETDTETDDDEAVEGNASETIAADGGSLSGN